MIEDLRIVNAAAWGVYACLPRFLSISRPNINLSSLPVAMVNCNTDSDPLYAVRSHSISHSLRRNCPQTSPRFQPHLRVPLPIGGGNPSCIFRPIAPSPYLGALGHVQGRNKPSAPASDLVPFPSACTPFEEGAVPEATPSRGGLHKVLLLEEFRGKIAG